MSNMESRDHILAGLLKGVAAGHPNWEEWSHFVFTSLEAIIKDISLIKRKHHEDLDAVKKEMFVEVKKIESSFGEDLKKISKDVIKIGTLLAILVSLVVSVTAIALAKLFFPGIP